MLPRYFKDNGYHAAGGGQGLPPHAGLQPLPIRGDEYFDLITDLKTDGFLVPYRRPNHLTSFDWGPVGQD